jgi:hypothetical protein
MFMTVNVFSQNADTSDYFRVGLYGGSYISGHEGIVEKNALINTTGLEIEYIKTRYLSFYFRSIYEFTKLSNNATGIIFSQNTSTHRLAISFGAKYYLREKNVKPYFQLGLNHEANYIDNYTTYYFGYPENTSNEHWRHYYSVNFGVGVDIKLYKKFSADIHYDLYRILQNEYSDFQGFSVLAGLKYNIVY